MTCALLSISTGAGPLLRRAMTMVLCASYKDGQGISAAEEKAGSTAAERGKERSRQAFPPKA